jgi:hypothetical protein
MCFTTEQSKFTIPLLFRRSDLRKSYIIIFLKLPYNGVTVDKLPYCAVTSGHHVNVDLPNKSGSIQEVIFYTNKDAKRGCSYRLLKKRIQFFWHNSYKFPQLVAKNSTEQRVSSGALRNAQRNILRSNVSARAKTCVPPCNYKRAGPKQPNITLPYSNVVIARAYTN